MQIDAVNSVPIVGQPAAYGIGFLVIVVLGSSPFVGKYPLVLAHEGGHMLALVLFLRPLKGFTMEDDTNALTTFEPRRWAISNLPIAFAGYAAPCLLGLGGAALIASGTTWGVLILGLFFSFLAIFPARNGLAILVPVLIVAGIGWALIAGTPYVQAAVAVGVVWYLLIGGLLDGFELPARGGDAATLAGKTGIVPGFVWKLAWIAIGVVCLWRGGRLLLAPGT